MSERSSAICADTGVLTATLRGGSALEARYRRHLTGRRLVIATQVLAEARFGALRAGWGPRRQADLERLLRSGTGCMEPTGPANNLTDLGELG